MGEPHKLPLLFRRKDVIAGRGFFAGVDVVGRALFVRETEHETWIYGVNPGGLAGGGADRNAAWLDFKDSYIAVLYDIASEAESFAAFEREAKSFFAETNKPTEKEWQEALDAVRREGIKVDDLITVDASRSEIGIRIENLQAQQITPDANAIGQLEAAA